MNEFEVCQRARMLLDVRVDVRYAGKLHVGKLTGVSPVNAWIKVGGAGEIPADLVTDLRAHE